MEKTAQEYLELALQSKNLEKKLEHCNKYLEMNPSNKFMWDYKRMICENLGKADEVQKCSKKIYGLMPAEYKKAMREAAVEGNITYLNAFLEKNPKSAIAWYHKGSFITSKKPIIAIKCFDKSLKLTKSKILKSFVLGEKGLAFMVLRKNKKALSCFEKALDIALGNPRILAMKTQVLNDIEKYKEAIMCYNKVIEIFKANPEYASMKKITNKRELKNNLEILASIQQG